ncbi:MAG: hypothetical protein ABW328_10225 [Ilumatobacteraceae bacterium]
MTDHFDDDTQFWDEPAWNRTGPIERIRQRDVSGSIDRITGSIQKIRHRDVTGPVERTRTHRTVQIDTRPDAQPPTEALMVGDLDGHDGRADGGWDDASWAPVDHWVEPVEEGRHRGGIAGLGVDPKLMRIGAVGLVGVLMIPIALAVRDDPNEGVRSDEASDGAAVTTTAAPAVLPTPTATVVTVLAEAATPPAPGPQSVSNRTASAPAPAPQAAQPQCAGTYTVIANDFWNRFPKTSGATAQEWLSANNATADTPLYVGDELCIPPGATAPDPPPATTVPPTTAPPATTAAPVPVPAPTPAPALAAVAPPAITAARAPAPTSPPTVATTTPPAAIAAGAPSTEALCGAMPTNNGAPAGTPDAAQVEAIIREVWPDDVEVRALCIAKREAKLRADLNNWCCYGVFALYFDYVPSDLKATYGVDHPSDLYDARTNISIAYQVYLRGGWKPWSQTDPGDG